MRLVVALGVSLSVCAAVLPSTAAAANDKLRLGMFGSGKPVGPLLSRTELRECIALQGRIKSGNESAAADREQLEKEKAELLRQGEELKAQFAALDRTSVEAIEQYRVNALTRDKAIDAFEARTSEFNARVTRLGEERAEFSKRCDNRRFDELDEIAIRNGK
jgi:hypothetical protein